MLICACIVVCSADKPGICPPREGGIWLTVCKWDCASDYGSPGEQKCCSYGGCEDVCRTPILKPPYLCTCVCVTSSCPCCPDGSGNIQIE